MLSREFMAAFPSSQHNKNTTRIRQQLWPSRGRLDKATGSNKSSRKGKRWLSVKSFFMVLIVILAAFLICQYSLTQLLWSVMSRPTISGGRIGPSLVRKTNEQQHLYNICVVTRIRNDYLYIREWIEYHKILGVDQFFIADDCSDREKDGIDSILLQYEKEGVVTYSPNQTFNDCHNHSPNQTALFQLMYNMTLGKCQWIGLWDVDEFITVSSGGSKYKKNFLLDYLNSLPHGIARLVWMIMGSDGHEAVDPMQLVIERYLNGTVGPLANKPQHIAAEPCQTKSIFRWDVTLGIGGPNPAHYPLLKPFPGMDYYKTIFCHEEELKPYKLSLNGNKCLVPTASIFLRHYRSKSWEEYMLGRGSRLKEPHGAPNRWHVKPREKWEKFWIRSKCAKIGENFTSWMAEELRKKLNMYPASSIIKEIGGIPENT